LLCKVELNLGKNNNNGRETGFLRENLGIEPMPSPPLLFLFFKLIKIKTKIMAQTILPQNRVFSVLGKNVLPAIIIVVFIVNG
jgi:hypothetical protein